MSVLEMLRFHIIPGQCQFASLSSPSGSLKSNPNTFPDITIEAGEYCQAHADICGLDRAVLSLVVSCLLRWDFSTFWCSHQT
jgi:hypothetical protein